VAVAEVPQPSWLPAWQQAAAVTAALILARFSGPAVLPGAAAGVLSPGEGEAGMLSASGG